MKSKIETGGPAFPILAEQADDGWAHVGMTLRDYFAAKVMQTMCEEVSRYDQFKSVANDAYKMADAMLKARSATPP